MSLTKKTVTFTEIVEPIQTKEEVERLFEEGRNALMSNDLEEACDKLGDSSALAVKVFGDFAPGTFEPYFYYGKALLSLALTEKEIEDSIIQEGQALEESPAEQQDEDEVEMDQTLKPEDDDEDEEDVAIVQLAFECLEYARLVCERNVNDSSMWIERQKDTFILLGQVHLNGDNLTDAIKNFDAALKIMGEHFPTNFREASNVHLELGRIHRKENNFTKSSSHIQKSIDAIQQLKSEVDEMLEDSIEEQKLTQLRESEYKGKAPKFDPAFDDKLFKVIEVTRKKQQKSVEPVQVKKGEKRPAGDSTEAQVDLKKSKIEEGPADEIQA